MAQCERRIRSLKLRGRDDVLLLQARYRLEDAFRTAALPGLPPNALVLIRRLDLGSIRADQPPTLLAGTITELIRNLATTAVCIDYQAAATANVVWFSDPLQPYRVLLSRLLDGQVMHEWYWRTLFPDKTLALNSDTIEMVLLQSADLPLKGLGPARLLECALEPRRLMKLLAFITPALARRILHEQGLSPVAIVNTRSQTNLGADTVRLLPAPDMSPPWWQALRQAVQRWSERDVRALWLAWHALIVHRPAYLERKDTLQRIAIGDWLNSWALDTGGAEVDNRNEMTAKAARDSPEAGFNAEALFSQMPGTDALLETTAASAQSVTADLGLQAIRQDFERAIYPSRKDLPTAINAAAGLDVTVETKQKQQQSDASPTDLTFSLASVFPAFSPHAGFVFIIPLMQRIGLAELLALNESLVALDFPRRLLWSMAQRFRVVEDDPARKLFEGFEPRGDVAVDQYSAPAVWRLLETGSGRPLDGLHIREQEHSIRLDRLIRIMQLLGALYLRRHSSISLRALVKRPGRVALTATHWDVIFDINQTDLRLRRVAFDSNRGWVAWLGRVVQVHYEISS